MTSRAQQFPNDSANMHILRNFQMQVKKLEVKPIEPKKIKHPKSKAPHICVCKAIRPGVILCRCFGLFPITSQHFEGRCVFRISKIWLVYSILTILFLVFRLVYATDVLEILNIADNRPLHAILSSINDIIFATYITLLTIFCSLRAPKFVKTLNNIAPLMNDGLLCESARKVILSLQYCILIFMLLIVAIQYVAIMWLHFSESYETNFDYKIYINRLSQNISFVFYVMFFFVCGILMGLFGCFEKLMSSCLKFSPVHPMQEIDESNNEYEFLGKFLCFYTLTWR